MNLISKKDLLAITGISYGQLYRWKRERLIPEEWFVKQASYTGQETFFPRDQIMSRIKSILELKDEYSLEELSKILSPEMSATVSRNDLNAIDEIDKELLVILPELYPKEKYEILDIAFLALLCECVKKAGLTPEQLIELARHGASVASIQKSTDAVCTVFLSGDKYHTLFSKNADSIVFDSSIQVIAVQSISDMSSKIKMKYKNLFNNK